jgi:hypothetical protein
LGNIKECSAKIKELRSSDQDRQVYPACQQIIDKKVHMKWARGRGERERERGEERDERREGWRGEKETREGWIGRERERGRERKRERENKIDV